MTPIMKKLSTREDIELFLKKDGIRIPFSNIATSIKAFENNIDEDQYPISRFGGSCAEIAYYINNKLADILDENCSIEVKNVIEREEGRPLGHHSNFISIDEDIYNFDFHLYPENLLPIRNEAVSRAIYNKTDNENPTIKSTIEQDKCMITDGKRVYYYSLNNIHEDTFVSDLKDSIIYKNRINRIRKNEPFIFQGIVNGVRSTLVLNYDDIIKDSTPYDSLLFIDNTGKISANTKHFKEKAEHLLNSFADPLSLNEFNALILNLKNKIQSVLQEKGEI